MTRVLNRPIERCPVPNCGGQILVHYEWPAQFSGPVRYLSCSFCGRDPQIIEPILARRRRPVGRSA